MLTADPCSLLDLVRPELADRFRQLAEDHDGQGGRITPRSECEARLSLTLEAHGVLSPVVTRPLWGDARDGDDQIWDFKAPRSRAAIAHQIRQRGRPGHAVPPDGYPGEFDVTREADVAWGQQRVGKGVVFDVRRLTLAQAQALIAAVTRDARLDPSLIRFYPTPDALDSMSGSGTSNGN